MVKTGFITAIAVLMVFALLAAGCQSTEETAENSEKENEVNDREYNDEVQRDKTLSEAGFEIHLPQDWSMTDRNTSKQDTVEIVLESSLDDRGKAILAYFPLDYFSEEEVQEEAERVLSSSLYNVEGSIEKEIREMAGNRVTVFSATAGDREPMLARTAVVSGNSGHLLLTLMVREEAEDYFSPYLRYLIEGLEME